MPPESGPLSGLSDLAATTAWAAGALGAIAARPIIQVCWVVNSIEEAVPRFVELTGAGPFVLASHIPFEDLTYRGAPAELDQSSAIGQLGGVQLELFEQHCDNPSGAREMFPKGSVGMQHITWFAADFDAECARLNALGFATVKTARLPNMGRMRIAWFDARDPLGVMVEVYEESDLMRRLYAKVARISEGWDGRDPLRRLPEALRGVR